MSTHKRTKLLPPYAADGSTNFPARNRPGVYLIYREVERLMSTDTELRYVGYSASDVYKALYRYFQTWNDRQAKLGQRNERVTFQVKGNIRVRVIYCASGADAAELERALIIKHQPPNNPDKLTFYELTDEGKALTKVPSDADFVTDMEAPF